MDQKSGKPSQKRRAILQGSLAAPVVLTVSSPSAATMTTVGRCLANLDNAPKPPYLVDAIRPGDTWMRIRVPVVKLTRPNNEVIYEFAFYDNALNGYRKVESPHDPVVFSRSDQNNFSVAPNGERWGLQWVDDRYKVESSSIQIQPPSGYRAVTGTCWTSFVKSA
jgi:hypothetical protein